jgi:hypothetical protein
MKATVEISADHYFIEPERKYTLDVLRVQHLDNTTDGVNRYLIGNRLQDSSGVDVTDFEHDNAWQFRMEVACMNLTMLTADWIEMVGVVIELQSWGDEIDKAWEGAAACTYCMADEGESRRHIVVEHYTPPRVKGMSGKWVKIRMLPNG